MNTNIIKIVRICYANTFVKDIRENYIVKKFVNVFRQCKQLLDIKNCNYRQSYI